MSVKYEPKTKPFEHQAKFHKEAVDIAQYAIFWEQGCGKTKAAIDYAGELWLAGKIDGVLVVASNGVHRNWVTDEIPTHVPDNILSNSFTAYYESGKSGTKKHQAKVKRSISYEGLSWLTMSYEGFMTKNGKLTAKKFLTARKCLYVLDESDKIKTPGAKRAMSIVASGNYAHYKRVMTGTPITSKPFDVYTQMRFLDKDFWRKTGLGISDFASFKTYFGIWKTRVRNLAGGKKQEFPVLVSYRNLDKLQEIIAAHSSRLLKADVLSHLPKKLYSKVWFELTPEQRRLYNEIENEFTATLQNGQEMMLPLPIVRLTRLQQVTSNYFPSDDDNDSTMVPIDDKNNPRLKTFMEDVESTPHSAIIWAKYSHDIDLIIEQLQARGLTFGRYDGKVDDDARALTKAKFQAEEIQFFVGNPAAGSDGITLTRAKSSLYYNNSYNYRHRVQSEDRAHRIGQEGVYDEETGENAVLYKDYCAVDTKDADIVENLVKKREISNLVLGDERVDWIDD